MRNPLAGFLKFIAEIFQDVDGGYSAKRTAFFLLLIAFLLIAGGVYFRAVDAAALGFLSGVLDKIKELLTWLGGFIVIERAPQLMGRKPEGDA